MSQSCIQHDNNVTILYTTFQQMSQSYIQHANNVTTLYTTCQQMSEGNYIVYNTSTKYTTIMQT